MFLNGYQVDIQTIVLFNEFGRQNKYQHIYYVRNDASSNIIDPCSSAPCLNGGTCYAGYYNEFNCLCTRDYTGN